MGELCCILVRLTMLTVLGKWRVGIFVQVFWTKWLLGIFFCVHYCTCGTTLQIKIIIKTCISSVNGIAFQLWLIFFHHRKYNHYIGQVCVIDGRPKAWTKSWSHAFRWWEFLNFHSASDATFTFHKEYLNLSSWLVLGWITNPSKHLSPLVHRHRKQHSCGCFSLTTASTWSLWPKSLAIFCACRSKSKIYFCPLNFYSITKK